MDPDYKVEYEIERDTPDEAAVDTPLDASNIEVTLLDDPDEAGA